MGEWEQRRLCPDGACVGVIGAGGRCNVCGEIDPTWTATPAEARAGAGGADDREDLADSEAAVAAVAPPAETEPSDWDDRTLCADGACTGLVPAPGARCTVCGRTAAEITAESAG